MRIARNRGAARDSSPHAAPGAARGVRVAVLVAGEAGSEFARAEALAGRHEGSLEIALARLGLMVAARDRGGLAQHQPLELQRRLYTRLTEATEGGWSARLREFAPSASASEPR